MGIIISNLNKELSGIKILDNISINLEYGKVYGFYGKNGSGKTMLFRAIAGLIVPSSGTIEIDGKTLFRDIRVPESIGVIIENPSFWEHYTGFENLKALSIIKGIINNNDINYALETVGLADSKNLKVRKYSLGMKQRLAIAQAIMEKPKILLLDEPTNGLDDDGVDILRQLVLKKKADGGIVLVSSHYVDDIELLSDVKIEIKKGKIENIKENVVGGV